MTDMTGYNLCQRLDKVTWLIIQVWFMLKLELNYQDWLDKMRSIMKNKEDNKVTDRTGVIFAQQDTELLTLIRWGMVYNED